MGSSQGCPAGVRRQICSQGSTTTQGAASDVAAKRLTTDDPHQPRSRSDSGPPTSMSQRRSSVSDRDAHVWIALSARRPPANGTHVWRGASPSSRWVVSTVQKRWPTLCSAEFAALVLRDRAGRHRRRTLDDLTVASRRDAAKPPCRAQRASLTSVTMVRGRRRVRTRWRGIRW